LEERQGSLLLTAVTPVAGWPTKLPDLRSRIVILPAVDVGVPDDPLIGAVLVKMFSDRQLRVGQDVIAYLLTHMERSFSAARRIVAALDSRALAAKRRITVPFVAEVLGGR
jgi:chromosomal replication initiation ATPase DnaA